MFKDHSRQVSISMLEFQFDDCSLRSPPTFGKIKQNEKNRGGGFLCLFLTPYLRSKIKERWPEITLILYIFLPIHFFCCSWTSWWNTTFSWPCWFQKGITCGLEWNEILGYKIIVKLQKYLKSSHVSINTLVSLFSCCFYSIEVE